MAARPGMAERGAWGDAAWRQAPVHTKPPQKSNGVPAPSTGTSAEPLAQKLPRGCSAGAVLHSQ